MAQRAGIPLREVSAAMNFFPLGETVTVKHWEKLSTQWTYKLDDRIARLQRLRDGMGWRGVSDVAACRLTCANW
nr:MerR family DNA-binding protein [Phaeobacter gallaeciensis]